MNGEILFLLISHIICFIIMIIWIYKHLKRPFTLADLLFFPDEKCIKRFCDVDDVQLVSIIKWIPGINFIVCGMFFTFLFIYSGLFLFNWLHNNIIKKTFGKIIFK